MRRHYRAANRFICPRLSASLGRVRSQLSFLFGVIVLALCTLRSVSASAAGSGGGAGAGGNAGAAGVGGAGGANAPSLDSDLPTISALSAKNVVRGSPVVVSGKHFGSEAKKISLKLGGVSIGNPIAASDQSFTFIVPEKVDEAGKKQPIPLGEALLRVSIEGVHGVANEAADPFDAGRMHVVADATVSTRLTGVSPSVGTFGDLHKLTLMGDNFPLQPEDLALLVDGVEVPLCWRGKCDVLAKLSGHELVLENQAMDTGKSESPNNVLYLNRLIGLGKHEIALRVGEQDATTPVNISISNYTSADIRWRALGLGLGLLLLMALLVIAGGTYTVGHTRYVLRAFLIDTETESYSLGKLQFFLWTVAALLAYGYLVLSRFLVQGHFDLPDVPDGLPGIILISATTTTVSIGITAARGPKGAGTAEPSFADLVSVGGVVSPERFQFLLWTFVGVITFLAAALQLDPFQIDTLPAIPPTLLTLSGVSAAGYLGGKIVRSPGPVISEVMTSVGSLILTINGRNLSRFARFEINGKSITPLLAPPTPDFVLQPELGAAGNQFAKSLKLVIAKADPDWLVGAQPPRLELAIINEDGQRSAYELNVDNTTWLAFTGLPKAAPPSTPVQPPPDPPTPGTETTDNTSHNTLEPESKS